MSEDHLSIGEVLAELADDHPDITISKIRFLESQGLIAPERTPSGYRKFYPGDIERLRWILHQQKDNFLPLKVIRERLAAHDGAVPPDETPDDAPRAPEPPAPAKRARKSGKAAGASARKGAGKGGRGPGSRGRARAVPTVDVPRLPLDDGGDAEQLAELESYGLVAPVSEGDRVLFDEGALLVARTAGAFAHHGIEARHLRMYRNFAEREAGMFEQVLLPHLRQRNPEARARAQEQLEELGALGRTMRAALLRRSVDRALGG